MNFFITYDAYWETKIDKVLDTLQKKGYKAFFAKQNYGDLINKIAVVLMCQDPRLNLKQRIRLSKKEKTLYLDIMLDQDLFVKIDQNEREKIVSEKLIREIPEIINKYKLKDFNMQLFNAHLVKVFG